MKKKLSTLLLVALLAGSFGCSAQSDESGKFSQPEQDALLTLDWGQAVSRLVGCTDMSTTEFIFAAASLTADAFNNKVDFVSSMFNLASDLDVTPGEFASCMLQQANDAYAELRRAVDGLVAELNVTIAFQLAAQYATYAEVTATISAVENATHECQALTERANCLAELAGLEEELDLAAEILSSIVEDSVTHTPVKQETHTTVLSAVAMGAADAGEDGPGLLAALATGGASLPECVEYQQARSDIIVSIIVEMRSQQQQAP